MLRDHVSRVVARRMAGELSSSGRVAWLDHLAFETEGLSYRPAGFLKRRDPVFLPYQEMDRYLVDDGQFRLWMRGQNKPAVTEAIAQKNFFPGFVLLMMLLSPPAAPPAETPAEPVWN